MIGALGMSFVLLRWPLQGFWMETCHSKDQAIIRSLQVLPPPFPILQRGERPDKSLITDHPLHEEISIKSLWCNHRELPGWWQHSHQEGDIPAGQVDRSSYTWVPPWACPRYLFIWLFLRNLCYGGEVSVYSVMSDSLWSHGLLPTRLLCPWNFPG